MGYAYYEIPRDNGKKMKRGYGAGCKCHKRGCTKQIDRGLAYLCYNCTWYYCGEHLNITYDKNDEPIEVECFAGESTQVCENCMRALEQQSNKLKESK